MRRFLFVLGTRPKDQDIISLEIFVFVNQNIICFDNQMKSYFYLSKKLQVSIEFNLNLFSLFLIDFYVKESLKLSLKTISAARATGIKLKCAWTCVT